MSSKQYFEQVAEEWDGLREGFFSENVRETAFRVADLKKGDTAVDIGAGTGFVTEGLLARGVKTIAIDQVPEMLAVLKRKTGDHADVDCRLGESEALPVRDEEVNYAFANMYLHHVENPPVAITEMYRILKPGGRLVITDLDSHNHEYLRVEHNDRWMGFERDDIKKWFEASGFKDITVDCVGETCDSSSCSGEDTASISIFVASGVK